MTEAHERTGENSCGSNVADMWLPRVMMIPMNTSAAAAFDTIPSTNYLELLGENPDWKKTVDFLAFKKDDVARAAGVSRASVRYDDRIPDEVRERLIQIANICELVAEFFNGDRRKTALWFQVPNPLLGHVSPRDMIRLGRCHKVLRLVQEARQAETRARSARATGVAMGTPDEKVEEVQQAELHVRSR